MTEETKTLVSSEQIGIQDIISNETTLNRRVIHFSEPFLCFTNKPLKLDDKVTLYSKEFLIFFLFFYSTLHKKT